jgi:hypothetical protein
MKKLFILAIAICSLCSCAITTHSFYGNVTTFTPQGDTLKVYENVLVQEHINGYITDNAFKSFGLNFTDSTGTGIVIGNIPYLIEYKVEVKTTPDYYEEPTYDN